MPSAIDDRVGIAPASDCMLCVESLSVTYPGASRRALDGVDLRLPAGQTVGVVGESGSGKSTLGNAVLGLVPVESGTIRLNDEDITTASRSRRRQLSAKLQAVYQDPYSSLNPARTIGQSIAEGLTAQRSLRKADVAALVAEVIAQTGLPKGCATRYPTHLSGGQRQRVALARAVIGKPRVVVCDEVTSALDLSVKAQVLNLLQELQRSYSLSLVFIGHDLPVVRHLSHRITVLYRGRVVEEGPAADVYDAPMHPYTRALLAASPVPDPQIQRQRRDYRHAAVGHRPGHDTAAAESIGCPFAPRCEHAEARCRAITPALETWSSEHSVACLRVAEI